MIEIKKVTKKYGNNIAVNNVSFKVGDGEIFAFIGHNGAGKTTLIKCITGIQEFDSGSILINGKSIKENPVECKKEMAFVPDNPELYEQMKYDSGMVRNKDKIPNVNYAEQINEYNYINDIAKKNAGNLVLPMTKNQILQEVYLENFNRKHSPK